MARTRKIFTNLRVIILLACLILAVAAIRPMPWRDGAAIRNIDYNSSATMAGITKPTADVRPMLREVIISINNVPISNAQDFYDYEATLTPGTMVQIKTSSHFTDDGTLSSFGRTRFYNLQIPEFGESDNSSNSTISVSADYIVDLGLEVYDAPTTNIKKGLDIGGGTSILLKPEEKLSPDQVESVVSNMEKRLNVYGLSDIVVREANDLENQYIMVEIAGATREEVRKLIESQGKFEAKIGNETVFVGGQDITHVYRTAGQSGIDPRVGCNQIQDGTWTCGFYFAIALTPEAAEKHADITDSLEVISDGGNSYLSEDLNLYLDDELVNTLKIGADLKGSATTNIQISGPGYGRTRQEAAKDSYARMKEMQTVLETGSLPVKLITESVSVKPGSLGNKSIKVVLLIGLASIFAVALVIFGVYRKLAISIPLFLTSVSEVVLLLGFAAFVGWNLDLAAIAGIIIAVGTGVDHLIVISDEILKGEISKMHSWKDNIKRAFFIIMASFFTTAVAMLFLGIIGAGVLRGFALTTVAGLAFGVFIARPAYAAVVEILLKK